MTYITNAAVTDPHITQAPKPAAEAGSGGYLFGRGETLWAFSLFCLLMIADFADRLVIAALLPSIRAEWQITDAEAGLLSSVLAFGMVVFALPAALATDRWSRVKTASLMGVVWGLASGFGAFAQNFNQLVISRAAVGAGEGGYAPAAYAWISAAFPKHRRQFALGVFSACQPIGMAIGVVAGGYIAAHYGWRAALGVLALPGFVFAALLYRARDYKTRVPSDDAAAAFGVAAAKRDLIANLTLIFRTPSLCLAYASGALNAFQWVPAAYFLPSFFTRVHHLPSETASLLTSGMLLISIPAIPLGGYIMDRLDMKTPKGKLTYGPLAIAIGTLIYGLSLGLAEHLAVQYAGILLASFIMASGATTALGMTQELVPAHIRALSGTCSIIILHLLGSTPGPYVTGLLSDAYGLTTALTIVLVVAGGLSVAALLFSRRYYLQDLAKAGGV